MIQEVRAYLSYRRIKKPNFYWRAKGLIALKEEKLIKKHIVVGQFLANGVSKNIDYINYEDFLKKLWNGEVI